MFSLLLKELIFEFYVQLDKYIAINFANAFFFHSPFLCRIVGDICILLVSRDRYASDASEFASSLAIQTRNGETQDF